MAANFALTPDQVKKAVATVIQKNPDYADMLGFYSRLFQAQEESKSRLQIEPLQIPDDVRAVKAQEKFPLIEIKDFAYDKIGSANLFVTIGKLAEEANPKLAASASTILKAIDTNFEPERLFNALLTGDEAVMENISEALEIDKRVLGFITYNSLKPCLCMGADQLSAYLSKEDRLSICVRFTIFSL